nr:MAG TPA_asm: hypothetical protein [Caudoviricetes sp.]
MYIVKTLRQMQYLVRNGFDCKKIEKSLKDSERVVFAFEKTDELMKCMREWI